MALFSFLKTKGIKLADQRNADFAAVDEAHKAGLMKGSLS